jgi:capsular polysaccharide biosynthesis protein
MNENQKLLAENQKIKHLEDEIELIDIFRVLWKWKYFIIAGTVFCGLIAMIISHKMAKIYYIDMVLRPAILKVEEGGNDVYIDSAKKIKAMIDSGTFNNVILDYLNDTTKDTVPRKLNFKVTTQNYSNTIHVRYETANVNQGMAIQNHLSKLLSEAYGSRIKYYISEYDLKQNSIKHEIDYLERIAQSCKRNIKTIEKHNKKLLNEIRLIRNNTADLVAEKNKFLSKTLQKNDGLQILFYTYLIRQNEELSIYYQNLIKDNNLQKEDEIQTIQSLTYEIKEYMDEFNKLQLQKEKIQNIKIIDSATKNPYPVRPKTKLNVIFGLVVGLFIMMFLSFCLEYLKKYKNKESL